MAGGGGQQGAAAPAQGGANVFSGSTNPTPYQGSAAQQNLGQPAGVQGSFADQYQQAQNNALGTVSAPAGGGQGGTRANMFGNPNQSINGYTPAGQPQGQQGSQPPQGSSPSGMQPPQNVYGMGGAQGPSAPTYGGSTNPTLYQDSAAQQNLGPAMGAMSPAGGAQGYAHSGAMQYNPQGQQPPTIGATPQNQNFMTGADSTGNMPGGNMGFDNSGSDGGVGGQPAPMQTPFAPQGGGMSTGRPPKMSDFRQQQGLQIQGNPTAQPVGGPYGGITAGRRRGYSG